MKFLNNSSFKILLILVLSFLVYSFTILGLNWNLDPNYSIKFAGKKAEGTFSGLSGKIIFDKSELNQAKFEVSVKVNTIKTGNGTKDKHAQDESWLDASNFPNIKFNSTSFIKKGDKYIVTGTLELHGTKKEVMIPFVYTEDGNKAIFEGSFKLNRKDYGIKGNFMGFLVGEEFDISLKIPVSKLKG